MLWPPARITVVLIRLLSTLLPITVDPPFAFASSTLTPTFPSNPLGVSALAGPNIRLQSDRAGSARSLSPRPPSSDIFSERTQTPLTALLFAHHVRHVCMSSDVAQRKTRLRSRSFSFVEIIMFEVVSCAMRASRANHSEYSFRSSSWWKNCCFPTHMHHARSRASTCSRAALVDSSYVILLIIGKKVSSESSCRWRSCYTV